MQIFTILCHFVERIGPPAPMSAGHYTSEMNNEV